MTRGRGRRRCRRSGVPESGSPTPPARRRAAGVPEVQRSEPSRRSGRCRETAVAPPIAPPRRFEDFEGVADGAQLLRHEDDVKAALANLFQQLVRADDRTGGL
jgi:hypothetical protein